jgi:hypothetical protein
MKGFFDALNVTAKGIQQQQQSSGGNQVSVFLHQKIIYCYAESGSGQNPRNPQEPKECRGALMFKIKFITPTCQLFDDSTLIPPPQDKQQWNLLALAKIDG